MGLLCTVGWFWALFFYIYNNKLKKENKEINNKWGKEVNAYQMTVNNLKNKSK